MRKCLIDLPKLTNLHTDVGNYYKTEIVEEKKEEIKYVPDFEGLKIR